MHKYTKYLDLNDNNLDNYDKFVALYDKNNKKTIILNEIIKELYNIFSTIHVKDLIEINKYNLNILNQDFCVPLYDEEISKLKFFIRGFVYKFLSKNHADKFKKARILTMLQEI